MQYKLDYILELNPDKLDEFNDKFVNLVESLGASIGGGIAPYTKEDELIDLQDVKLLQKKINRKRPLRKSIPRKGKGHVSDGTKKRLAAKRRSARKAG